MKKLIALLLTLCMILSLVACGQAETAPAGQAAPEAAASAPEAPEAEPEPEPTPEPTPDLTPQFEEALAHYNAREYDVAFPLLQALADAGHANAIGYLGECYQYGYGVDRDYNLAIELYEHSAELGGARGQAGLAGQTAIDFGEEDFDYGETLRLLHLSAEQQDSRGLRLLGYMYRRGCGVEEDFTKAIEWYEKSAALNDTNAMTDLASLYWDLSLRRNSDADAEKVMEWYEKAAALGDDYAMLSLGIKYMLGSCVEQDYAKAIEWYEKSIALGNSIAMRNLGEIYYKGEGVEQDYPKAMELFEKASELGCGVSANYLGDMYYSGYGVSADKDKALEYYYISVERGYPYAKDSLLDKFDIEYEQ